MRGIMMHVPRNVFLALTGLRLSEEISYLSMYGTAFVFQFMAYPFLTIQRRLECRSNLPTQMLSNDIYKRGRFTTAAREIV